MNGTSAESTIMQGLRQTFLSGNLMRKLRLLLIAFAIIMGAMFCGAVVGLGSPILSLGLCSLVMLPFVILVPLDYLFIFYLLLVFVVAGSLQFFAKFGQAHWLPAAVLVGLLLRLPLEIFRTQWKGRSRPSMLFPYILVSIFFCLFLISGVANATGIMPIVVAIKNFVSPLALFIILLIVGKESKYWGLFWRGIPWLCIIQVPYVIYQHFFVAARRANSLNFSQISWDAVVGSFGGDPDGGGMSGTMALFLVFAIFAILSLYKNREIGLRLVLVSFGSIAITILLSEIKIVFVVLPVVALYYFRRDVFVNPVKTLGLLCGLFFFISVSFLAYQKMYWAKAGVDSSSPLAGITYMFKNEGNVNFVNNHTGEVSRLGAPLLWWRENVEKGDLVHALIGYGPSASRVSRTIGYGAAAKRYTISLTTNSVSSILWDYGLMGLSGILGLILWPLWMVTFSSRLKPLEAAIRSRLNAAAAGLLVSLVGFVYGPDAISLASMETIWISCSAYIFMEYYGSPLVRVAATPFGARSSVRSVA